MKKAEMAKSAKAIIDEAAELLRTAKCGLEDMMTIPGRAKTGLRNAVVFGRTTTWALQNLKSVTPDFATWYAQKQAEMKADPLMRYFKDLRTSIEKQAATPTTMSAQIHSFSSRTDMKWFEPRPPGATRLFIGDANGGSGWVVPLPDGTEERYYVQLPPELVEVHLHLPGAPIISGEANRAVDLVVTYLAKIEALVSEARQRFGQAG